MATGQDLLDTMEVLFPELDVQAGEADVNKALLCLNRAQDWFETHAAQYGTFKGSTVGTVTTTASQEYTTFPSGLMRLDGLDMLGDDNLPIYPLRPIDGRGGHAFYRRWPAFLDPASVPGKPSGYWTNGRKIYWSPLPNSTYTIRYYGQQSASDITVNGDFEYDDAAILPFASIAVKILRTGLDDSTTDLNDVAKETFNALLDALGNFQRDGAQGYQYTYYHDV